MARPKNDPKKIVAIVQVLARYPDGTWIRSIARDAKLHPTTVSHYLSGPLMFLVEESTLGSPDRKPLMRIVRLKPDVLDRLRQGDTVKQVIRLAGLLEKVRKQ
ncbi:MAG: hypothetical protein HYW25_02425 [Candidatus Aenigmarchaeota archaeon]|nr:hypothetical protein [Candidatus Aenigmarchaeota archaeon]